MYKLDPFIKAWSWLHKKQVVIYGYHTYLNDKITLDNIILDCTMGESPMIFRLNELDFYEQLNFEQIFIENNIDK